MSYFDGCLLAVANDRKDDYIAHAERFWPWLQKKGALSTAEVWGDDVPDGKLTSFPMAVKLEEGESVVLSWIEWPDKAARDAAWAGMESDPDFADMDPGQMPFDGKRMIFGGFAPILRK